MHDAEDRVDILVGKGVLLLRGKHNAVELFQETVGFEEKRFQNTVVARTHKQNPSFFMLLLLFYRPVFEKIKSLPNKM